MDGTPIATPLPDEVLLTIFARLDSDRDLLCLLRVCQQWRCVGLDTTLWRGRDISLRRALVLAGVVSPQLSPERNALRLTVKCAPGELEEMLARGGAPAGLDPGRLRTIVESFDTNGMRLTAAQLRALLDRYLSRDILKALNVTNLTCGSVPEMTSLFEDMPALERLTIGSTLDLELCTAAILIAAPPRLVHLYDKSGAYTHYKKALPSFPPAQLRSYGCHATFRMGFLNGAAFPALETVQCGQLDEAGLFRPEPPATLRELMIWEWPLYTYPCLRRLRVAERPAEYLKDTTDDGRTLIERLPVVRHIVHCSVFQRTTGSTGRASRMGWCLRVFAALPTLRVVEVTSTQVITEEGERVHWGSVFAHHALPDVGSCIIHPLEHAGERLLLTIIRPSVKMKLTYRIEAPDRATHRWRPMATRALAGEFGAARLSEAFAPSTPQFELWSLEDDVIADT